VVQLGTYFQLIQTTLSWNDQANYSKKYNIWSEFCLLIRILVSFFCKANWSYNSTEAVLMFNLWLTSIMLYWILLPFMSRSTANKQVIFTFYILQTNLKQIDVKPFSWTILCRINCSTIWRTILTTRREHTEN